MSGSIPTGRVANLVGDVPSPAFSGLATRLASVIADERVLELLRDRLEAGLVCGGNPAAGSMMLRKPGATSSPNASSAPARTTAAA